MDTAPSKPITETGIAGNGISVRDLREAIPAHCFRPSYIRSFSYLFRDLAGVIVLWTLALNYIPTITNPYLYTIAWAAYGYAQGLFGTGLWVLGHESGHGAFSPSQTLNDIVGWTLHSLLLTPYFAWKSTHSRHHVYANHMEKDYHYVPLRREAYAAKTGVDLHRLEELTEDSPLVTAVRILIQQVFGWPMYVLVNLTAGEESTHPRKPGKWWQNSHFSPYSPLFSPNEFFAIIASDVGLGLTAAGLWYASTILGSKTIMLLYVMPYLWVNHWIVAITYLHHTHLTLPKYERGSWNFLKGALATVDRNYGFQGRFFFHNIIDFHVIHHIFSRIPFYHAEEATKAIIPILGAQYHEDKSASFIGALWGAFTDCQWVESDAIRDEDKGTLWYQGGPSPAPEYKMRSWRYLGEKAERIWL